jgi:hypothetical protein
MLSIVAILAIACMPCFSFGASDSVLKRATQLFGSPLNAEHGVYRLNDTYVLWLIIDRYGDLFEVDVGPKSYYTDEFPNSGKHFKEESLSETEFAQIIQKISELKEIGNLRGRSTHTVSGIFGPMNTVSYEKAFVERLVPIGNDDKIIKFDVYYLQRIGASPEQIVNTDSQSFVCFAEEWYYLPAKEAKRIKLGKWQTIQIAGPTLLRKPGCVRTTAVRDADGFTIEQPQTETIIISEPYTVNELAGRVVIGESPIETANVEFLRMESNRVLRARTDSSGSFRISRVPDGTYKFKVTKNGFKALRGTVIVDKHTSSKTELTFVMSVGT